MTGDSTRRPWFWVAFAAATLLIAGGVSYLASPSPDGLDSAILQGCEVVEAESGGELTGDCIARHATEHALGASPLADYAVNDADGTGGLAGIFGVLVTLAVAGAGFWVIARARSKPTTGG